jgi:RNA polymerase sigma factor (sigma-70 family)
MSPLLHRDRQASSEATDAELLARVAARASDPAAARVAQETFYERHVRYLYGALLRSKPSLLRAAGQSAEDLVQETFHRAFDKAHTFEPGDADAGPDRARARTRAWLGRIASHLLCDHLGDRREVSATPFVERVSSEDVELGGDEAPASPTLELVTEGLAQLSDREQDILRVTALHLKAGDHQRLPNDVSAELARQWSTTSENVRAIRMRAMKKLRAFLTAKGALAPEAS